MSQMQEQVYNILMMPVKVCKHSGFNDKRKIKIEKQDNLIETTQTYWPEYIDRNTGKPFRYSFAPDCDMSDFACGFYEIIYKDILQGKIVKDDGSLLNEQFAGDTMNSFNYIANRIPEAGKTKKTRTPYNTWPEYLQKYYDHYHCLANFWLLPMEIGRKNSSDLSKGYYDYKNWNGAHDYMDKFLTQVKYDWDRYIIDNSSYFLTIKDFAQFAKINCLVGSYLYADMSVFEYSKKEPEEIINLLQDRIRLRATAISESEKYCEKLYEYFSRYGLIKETA